MNGRRRIAQALMAPQAQPQQPVQAPMTDPLNMSPRYAGGTPGSSVQPTTDINMSPRYAGGVAGATQSPYSLNLTQRYAGGAPDYRRMMMNKGGR